MDVSLEERKRNLAARFRRYDLQDLKGAEFRRLLRLAHAEGLLAEVLRDTGIQYPQEDFVYRGPLDQLSEPENLSTGWPSLGQFHRRIASKLKFLKSLFRLVS